MPDHTQLSGAELVFAQKLASCDAGERRRALTHLKSWIGQRNKQLHEFSRLELLKLWKGLYYCMWIQDQPLLQEELADSLAALLRSFGGDAQAMLYVDAFFDVVSREWHMVDRWRMDKVMMLVRRMLRAGLSLVRSRHWSPDCVELFLDTLCLSVAAACAPKLADNAPKTAQSVGEIDASRHAAPDGLRYHVAAIYLDELDAAAGEGLHPAVVTSMLRPYFDILSERTSSDGLFSTVLHEIFETILVAVVDERLADSEADSDGEHRMEEEGQGEQSASTQIDAQNRIEFDLPAIAERLFAIGAAKTTRSNRRRRLYALVEKYRVAAAGGDPFDTVDKGPAPKAPKARPAARTLQCRLKKELKRERAEKSAKTQQAADGQVLRTAPVANERRPKSKNKFKAGKLGKGKASRTSKRGGIKKSAKARKHKAHSAGGSKKKTKLR